MQRKSTAQSEASVARMQRSGIRGSANLCYAGSPEYAALLPGYSKRV
jgi:hypothetical protein